MEQTQLIIFVIIVQITNVIGAYVLGHLVDKMGGKRALIISILLMVTAIILMYFTQTATFFFFVGALAGFAMAGMQSVSRTMVGLFSPPGQSAEFYGFFAVAGRTSSFIGPTVYGYVAFWIANWSQSHRGMTEVLAEQSGQRFAILSIGVFLLIGLGILTTVKENRRTQRKGLPQAE